MKNILVPYDFSEYAEAAMDFAIQMSQVTQAKVTLVHIIEYPLASTFNVSGEIGQFSGEDAIFTLELIKRTKQRVREYLDQDKFNNVNIHSQIMMGHPYEGILSITEKDDHDLIIMGTKGATGLAEMFVGSNAEKIVRNSICPVITIHKQQKFEGIKDIVYATNFEVSHGPILDKFKEMQELFNSTIHLVWVHTPHNIIDHATAKQKLEALAKEHHLTNYSTCIAKGFTPEDGILFYAQGINADMIGMATHGYKGLAHLFLGSVAEDIVNHGSIPVWTLSTKSINK